MRKKQKSWIQQLSESYIRQSLREAQQPNPMFPPGGNPNPQPLPEPSRPIDIPPMQPTPRPTGQVDPFAGTGTLDEFARRGPGTYELGPPGNETVIVNGDGTITVILSRNPLFVLKYEQYRGGWRVVSP
jgi:hypothetical protein